MVFQPPLLARVADSTVVIDNVQQEDKNDDVDFIDDSLYYQGNENSPGLLQTKRAILATFGLKGDEYGSSSNKDIQQLFSSPSRDPWNLHHTFETATTVSADTPTELNGVHSFDGLSMSSVSHYEERAKQIFRPALRSPIPLAECKRSLNGEDSADKALYGRLIRMEDAHYIHEDQ
jgi:hypothetical protein